MAELKTCPFDNNNCMCQFCEEPCNNGLNCFECIHSGEIKHSVYLCTGFKGDVLDYLRNRYNRGVEQEDKWLNTEKSPL